NMTIDGSTAQVCSQLAELLDLPSVMHVIDLHRKEDHQLLITQKMEHGYVRLEAELPLVISVRKELNKPRYTAFTGILAAESKEIKLLSNKELSIDTGLIGLEGSPTKMAGLELRQFEREKERVEGAPDEIVQDLVDKIHRYGII
ncbi:MAG: hypothetical protein HQ561_03635, partial [Desulfobacteraceae bacterium]|nr:hypothetical protein [Desulfobacteraceae bacterium]